MVRLLCANCLSSALGRKDLVGLESQPKRGTYAQPDDVSCG